MTPLLCLCSEAVGNVRALNLLTVGTAKIHRLHPQQINHTLVLLLKADRDDERHRVRGEAFIDRVERTLKRGAYAIQFIYEADARHAEPVRLAPDGLGLGLHAGYAVKHHDRAVQDAQGSLHFHGKINVPRRIYNIETILVLFALVRKI